MMYHVLYVRSLASVVQAQICEDDDSIPANTCPSSDFDIIPDLPVEQGGVVTRVSLHILNQETRDDDVLRDKIVRGKVPTIDTIYRYARYELVV